MSAMISPSTSRSRSPSGLVESSGHATVMLFSLRLVIRSVPSRTSVSARTPSHFTSCVQASPTGTWAAFVASIGRMPDIMPSVNSTRPLDNGTYAVIGAGPSGLAAARNLQRFGMPWSGYELASGVGGLWDIDGPRSTVYESAHLISSKHTTEFTEFPMREEVADYPSHRELLGYFRDFADDPRPGLGLLLRDRGRLRTTVGRRRLDRRVVRSRRHASSDGTRACWSPTAR